MVFASSLRLSLGNSSTVSWMSTICCRFRRRPVHRGGLIHHSDRGSQYVSIKYTERLAEAGIEPLVGSVGDSYDNALAETVNGLYKAEVIHRRGPWRSFEAVELVTLEWVDWFKKVAASPPCCTRWRAPR